MITKIIKHIFSRNNNVCLGGVLRWFLCVLLLLKIIVSMKRVYVYVCVGGFLGYVEKCVLFASMLF